MHQTGSGKSVILKILQEAFGALGLKDNIAFTAPTGVAACNVGGLTINSWAGIGLGTDDLETLCNRVRTNKMAATRWKTTSVLVSVHFVILCFFFDRLMDLCSFSGD